MFISISPNLFCFVIPIIQRCIHESTSVFSTFRLYIFLFDFFFSYIVRQKDHHLTWLFNEFFFVIFFSFETSFVFSRFFFVFSGAKKIGEHTVAETETAKSDDVFSIFFSHLIIIQKETKRWRRAAVTYQSDYICRGTSVHRDTDEMKETKSLFLFLKSFKYNANNVKHKIKWGTETACTWMIISSR